MDQETWLSQNRAAILERLRPLHDQADGTIYFEPAGLHFVVVNKRGTHLRLVLLEQSRPSSSLTQSRLDLADPLYLVAQYSQAMMLGLLWQRQPRRVYVVGFGGGRIPLVLHHYLPEAVIECTEIDPTIVEMATNFFGVQLDDRLRVTVQDGRTYLAQRDQPYDIILVDVVLGNGYAPYRLATREFYELCQARLTTAGVVVVNLLDRDPFYADKVKTLQSVFEQVYLCPVDSGNGVLIATAGPPVTETELLERARRIQADQHFSFPFVQRALALKTGSGLGEHIPDLEQAGLLSDATPPPGYFDNLPSFNTPFSQIAPEHPCPCGSGRPFRDCHRPGLIAPPPSE